MKPSAFRIERLLAKVEAEVAPPPRARRYAFHPDEVAEAEAQGLPYALVPRVLSKQEWLERYATPGAEAEFYARLRYGEQPAGADSGVKTIQEPAATALLPNCP
jgi:hypothetical protein